MKKFNTIFGVIAFIAVVGFSMIACDTGNSGYTVFFVTNGGSDVAHMSNITSIAAEPVSTRESYTFDGWFDNPGLSGSRVTFPYTVTANTTLYAKWQIAITYNIGDTGPGGGIIFYYSPDGFTVEGYGNPGDAGYFATYTAHYLEVSPANIRSFAQWGAYGEYIANVTYIESSRDLASTIGNGRKDTHLIVNYLKSMETGRAAQLLYCPR